MKNMKYIMMAFLAVSLLTTSCKEDEPFDTKADSDYPVILDPIFKDKVDGVIQNLEPFDRDKNLTMTVIVTPLIVPKWNGTLIMSRWQMEHLLIGLSKLANTCSR